MIEKHYPENDPTDAIDGSMNDEYEVLARKYRPKFFSDLIGQDVIVRTLRNAFSTGRVAHAFLLTGVRGVGKTTTARIIARALNCTDKETGKSNSAIEPCGKCGNCMAITEGSHVDVLEMDAASRTGVDDIRELIEGVRYLPTLGQFKIYIIDEIHMLSVNAFNALLKTLEEPPPRVKFIFATTEVRKIPVTVISRCQRFDLRRVDEEKLTEHFAIISDAEKARFDPEAMSLIVRAADGSVRDGLSLLDQAISHASGEVINLELVREMIGLADHARLCDLLEELLKGEIASALSMAKEQYYAGADPLVMVQDLLTITHWLTMLKVEKTASQVLGAPQIDLRRGQVIAENIGIGKLTRLWQMLLKGYGEIEISSSPFQATQMLLVRLGFASELPNSVDLVRKIADSKHHPRQNTEGSLEKSRSTKEEVQEANGENSKSGIMEASEPAADSHIPQNFSEVVQLFADKGEMRLFTYLQDHVHLISFSVGQIKLRLGPNAPQELSASLAKYLYDWTGLRWGVLMSDAPGDPTLAEQALEQENKKKVEASNRPEVKALLEAFPGAEVTKVKNRKAQEPGKRKDDSI